VADHIVNGQILDERLTLEIRG